MRSIFIKFCANATPINIINYSQRTSARETHTIQSHFDSYAVHTTHTQQQQQFSLFIFFFFVVVLNYALLSHMATMHMAERSMWPSTAWLLTQNNDTLTSVALSGVYSNRYCCWYCRYCSRGFLISASKAIPWAKMVGVQFSFGSQLIIIFVFPHALLCSTLFAVPPPVLQQHSAIHSAWPQATRVNSVSSCRSVLRSLCDGVRLYVCVHLHTYVGLVQMKFLLHHIWHKFDE